jgi:hypothetical protein
MASSACGAPARPAGDVIGASSRAPSRAETDAVDFVFDSLDARPVSAAATRGTPTVLAFVTTWDLTSQAQVDFLVPMSAHDGDKVTYALVALQEPQDRELVEAYKTTLKVTFPVALADRATIAGGGPFGDVHAVPTLVVLDRRGRIVWRQVGLARSDDIRAALKGL